MSKREAELYQSLALKRTALVRPLVALLGRLGLTPNMLTYSGVILMVGFAVVVPRQLTLAFWLFIASLVCDQLDGPLARYQKMTSDRGKFIDVTADATSFAIFLIGLIRAGLITGPPGALYIYLISLSRVLAVIENNVGRPRGDWLFFAGTDSAYAVSFLSLTYILFAARVLVGINWLQTSSIIFSLILIITVIMKFRSVIAKSPGQ